MDNYGTVFSVEHPDWSFHVKYLEQKGCIVDNYIVFLRRDEIKEDIEKILADIYENFKISVEPYWYAPKNLLVCIVNMKTEPISFFSDGPDCV